MDDILSNAKAWQSDFFDPAVKKEIQDLITNDPEELKDRFYKNCKEDLSLEFSCLIKSSS